MTPSLRPLPHVDDDSRPWWEALARHELTVQQCTACAHLRWPARALCNACGSLDWSWKLSAGRARVVTWIVNQHVFNPAFDPPYTVVVARLEDQPDLLIPAGFAGTGDAEGLAIDCPVEAAFVDVPAEEGGPFTLLAWKLLEAS